MKKNLLICMSLLMVIGITACGKENNADNNEISEVTFESLTELGDDANDEYQDPLPAEEDDGLDAPDVVTDEQALDAVKNFISSSQPEAVPSILRLNQAHLKRSSCSTDPIPHPRQDSMLNVQPETPG